MLINPRFYDVTVKLGTQIVFKFDQSLLFIVYRSVYYKLVCQSCSLIDYFIIGNFCF